MSEPKSFDYRTHLRDPKSGRVVKENHYRMIIRQEPDGPAVEIERPPGSGLYYLSNGEMDKKRSAEGIKRREEEERNRSRTELQKAEAELEAASARHKVALDRHKAEQRAQTQSAPRQ